MIRRFLTLFLVLAVSGCVSLEKGVFLSKGTPVQVIDVSKDPIVSGFAVTEYKPTALRLIEYTRKQLLDRNIKTVAEPTSGAAILKYDIRTVSRTYHFLLIYTATLETPDGKVVFSDENDKHESKIDELLDDIATRTARGVAKAFRQ